MLTLTLLTLPLSLSLPPLQDPDQEKPGPTKEQVEAALEQLDTAFSKKEATEVYTALQSVQLVTHPDVIEVFVDTGLRHKHADVRRASIEALGSLRHEHALVGLHKHYKRKKKTLTKDAEQFIPLLKAIALHEDESSVQILTDDIFSVRSPEVVKARILGLGKIRSQDSVEEIFDLMKKVDRRKVQPRMQDIRLALIVLTHVDQGTSQDMWLGWWNDNKKTFKLPKESPKLPKELANRWGRYWGEQRQYERQKRRGERGDDPEDDGDS